MSGRSGAGQNQDRALHPLGVRVLVGSHHDSGKNSKNRELKSTVVHIELPATLLDYFLQSNKSNINRPGQCKNSSICQSAGLLIPRSSV